MKVARLLLAVSTCLVAYAAAMPAEQMPEAYVPEIPEGSAKVQEIEKRINKKKGPSKKPLLDIAKCTGYTWDLIKEWCTCVDNCEEQRAYWQGLVTNAHPDERFVNQMMAGLESKNKNKDEQKVVLEIKKHMACDQYNQFQGRQMRVEVEMMVAGLYTCKPGAKKPKKHVEDTRKELEG